MEHLETRRDRLQQFFGGYFHQDWELEHRNIPDAVASYANEHMDVEIDGENVVALLIADLRWIIATQRETSSDDLWRILIDQYWSTYNGKFTGEDAHQWLEWIARRLENHLKKQRQ